MYRTIKIWETSKNIMDIIKKLTDESYVHLLDRLLNEELSRTRDEQSKPF